MVLQPTTTPNHSDASTVGNAGEWSKNEDRFPVFWTEPIPDVCSHMAVIGEGDATSSAIAVNTPSASNGTAVYYDNSLHGPFRLDKTSEAFRTALAYEISERMAADALDSRPFDTRWQILYAASRYLSDHITLEAIQRSLTCGDKTFEEVEQKYSEELRSMGSDEPSDQEATVLWQDTLGSHILATSGPEKPRQIYAAVRDVWPDWTPLGTFRPYIGSGLTASLLHGMSMYGRNGSFGGREIDRLRAGQEQVIRKGSYEVEKRANTRVDEPEYYDQGKLDESEYELDMDRSKLHLLNQFLPGRGGPRR